jgi:hypothetical protein
MWVVVVVVVFNLVAHHLIEFIHELVNDESQFVP